MRERGVHWKMAKLAATQRKGHVPSVGNTKGTLSAEHHRRLDAKTREQAK